MNRNGLSLARTLIAVALVLGVVGSGLANAAQRPDSTPATVASDF